MNRIRHWWLPVLLGILLVVSSFYIASQPVEAFVGLTLLFGWLITFNGVSNIIFALRNKEYFEAWQWNLMIGIFEFVLGLILIFEPGLSAQTLVLFTGFWLMFSAISRIAFSWVLKKIELKDWWVSLISGIIMLIFSVLLIINPVFAIISIVYLVSIPVAILGFILILFGFQLKKISV